MYVGINVVMTISFFGYFYIGSTNWAFTRGIANIKSSKNCRTLTIKNNLTIFNIQQIIWVARQILHTYS
jgi:hypothetical protein